MTQSDREAQIKRIAQEKREALDLMAANDVRCVRCGRDIYDSLEHIERLCHHCINGGELYGLARITRNWVPGWLWHIFCWQNLATWQPFKVILTRKPNPDDLSQLTTEGSGDA